MSYSFANRDGSFLNEVGTVPVRYTTPLTATTITLTNADNYLYVHPAGTIAALTIKLPPNPTPGMTVDICFGAVVTALTVQTSAGVAVAGAGSAGAIGVNQVYRWISEISLWKRWE
jgi:hypothetical protein